MPLCLLTWSKEIETQLSSSSSRDQNGKEWYSTHGAGGALIIKPSSLQSREKKRQSERERECTGEVLVMWDQWTAQEIWWPLSHLWGLPRTVPCTGFSSRFYQVQKDK